MIKYRFWDIVSEKMIYPDFVTLDNDGEIYGFQMFEYFFGEESELIFYRIFSKSEKYIIMKSLGFEDKNGKLIYEGDVLSGDFRKTEIKEYEERENCGCCGMVYGWSVDQMDDCEYKEILGNIYENKELMNV